MESKEGPGSYSMQVTERAEDGTVKRGSLSGVTGAQLEAVGFRLDSLRPALPADINPNIRETVFFLRRNGFNTTDSGDGETHLCECDREYGYVVMTVPTHKLLQEADRLKQVLNTAGIVTGFDVMTGDNNNDNSGPTIQASYDPDDGTAILDLSFITDDDLRAVGLVK